MEKIIDDKFMFIFETDEILNLCWKKETKNLTDEDFKNEALKYIEIVKDRNSKKIIVDMREFKFSLNDEVISWRNENIISVYNEIGVKKFAFISNKETVNQDSPKNTFTTKYFLNKKDAIAWLLK